MKTFERLTEAIKYLKNRGPIEILICAKIVLNVRSGAHNFQRLILK